MECIFDVENKNFTLNNNEIYERYIDLYFGFTQNNNLPVYFNNLKYGCKVFEKNKIIKDFLYPLNDIQVLSSDQKYTEIIRIDNLFPEIEYTLNFWVNNDNIFSKYDTTIILPKPVQPYPSWIYDEKDVTWIPPIPYPKNGDQYMWDEELLFWKILDS